MPRAKSLITRTFFGILLQTQIHFVPHFIPKETILESWPEISVFKKTTANVRLWDQALENTSSHFIPQDMQGRVVCLCSPRCSAISTSAIGFKVLRTTWVYIPLRNIIKASRRVTWRSLRPLYVCFSRMENRLRC